MSRVMLAAGRLAGTPYRIERIERNVFSIEELCYSIAQSVQILDADIMDPALVEWIDEECGLPALAEKLRPLLGKDRALSDFISILLDETGFVPEEKEARARQIVRAGEGMEPFARRMTRAAYLADNAQPWQALAEYDALLQDLPSPEKRFRAKALCEEGRIWADLFRFHQAAECYQKAYDCSGSSDVYLQYLAAVRMDLSDSEYLAFISEHPEAYNASLELETRMKQMKADYGSTEMAASIDALRRYKANHQDASYEITLHETLQRLKEDYRKTRAPAI